MNTPKSEPDDIKVSVAMITYNHEPFITQAIEGVLMQQTDFAVELVIGEDCSTDGTRAIVQSFKDRYPDQISLLLPENNLGMIPNFVATLKACYGQYVALCEGDDYWNDPLKLQKQVDFLEAHSECSMCFHDATVLEEKTSQTSRILQPSHHKVTYTLDDLLVENFIPTMTVMFRGGLINELPQWYYDLAIGDWSLHILNARYGRIGYINEIMAVYRMHIGGVWSGVGDIKHLLAVLDVYDKLHPHLGLDYDHIIRSGISRCCLELGAAFATKGQTMTAKRYLMRSIREAPINPRIVDQATLFTQLYIPIAYKASKYIKARLLHAEKLSAKTESR